MSSTRVLPLSERVSSSQLRRRSRVATPRVLADPILALGLLFVFFFLSLALFAPLIAPHDPFDSVAAAFLPPVPTFPLGTDDLGRDVLSGVIYGARTSLLVGMSVAGASLLIGTLVGSIAGFYGYWVDDLLMRVSELIQVMPRFFLALVVVALFGASLTNLILVLTLTYWSSTARLARAGVLAVKQLDYVTAARGLGIYERSVLLRHILPNAVAPLIIHAALQVGRAILIEASLSFLGLGDPNVISWGYMLNNAQPFMRRAWWMAVFPGSAIALTVLGVNLLGDGLNRGRHPQRYIASIDKH